MGSFENYFLRTYLRQRKEQPTLKRDRASGAAMETIGMIGTGAMGLALLERLKLAGVGEVVCYDAYAPALAEARQLGFTAVANVAEVAKRADAHRCRGAHGPRHARLHAGPNGVIRSGGAGHARVAP